MHVTELTQKSAARRSRRASTRRASSYIHTTHYAPTFLPNPSPRAQLLSKVSLARKDRPVAAIASTSCNCSISEPFSSIPLTAAADASRRREKERERDAVAQRCIGHPTDGACEHRQCTDVSGVAFTNSLKRFSSS